MLERVTAHRFDGRMGNGKTWPCKLTCEAADGQEIEVVAKFSAGCERRVGGLVAEAIGAMAAADLDLGVPEPYLVAFDDAFVDAMPPQHNDMAKRMRDSVRVAFGSRKLPPGFTVWPHGKGLLIAIRQQAAEIFAFDCLIENPDRRPENPNLLLDGRSFAIFDHELALFPSSILFRHPPWEVGALQATAPRHALFEGLKGRSYDWARLQGAWEGLTDDRLDAFMRALPPEWKDGDGAAAEALVCLRNVRQNIRPALAEVARVLA